MERIDSEQLYQILKKKEKSYALIDVRERDEYVKGQIYGASQISLPVLSEISCRQLPVKDIPIYLYSNHESRAGKAAAYLEAEGYTDVHVLKGGFTAYTEAGLPVVSGIHVRSKVQGEIIAELDGDVKFLTAEELHDQRVKEKLLIVEVRPPEETEITGSIPGAIHIPGFELPLYMEDLKNSGKEIILTCAGRTRGIVATATIGRLGLGKVRNLKYGTLGWRLAGYDLQPVERYQGKPSERSKEAANLAARELAVREEIAFISVEELQDFLHSHASVYQRDDDGFSEGGNRTIYYLDVRQKEDFTQNGHIGGFQSFPGGQAVQNTDDVLTVKGAEIIFVCEDETRSILTAYWYKKMGITGCKVLRGGINAWRAAGKPLIYEAPVIYENLERERAEKLSHFDLSDARYYFDWEGKLLQPPYYG